MSKKSYMYWFWPLFVFLLGPLTIFCGQVIFGINEPWRLALLFWPIYAGFLADVYASALFILVPFLLASLGWWFKQPGFRSGFVLLFVCNGLCGLPGYHVLLQEILRVQRISPFL